MLQYMFITNVPAVARIAANAGVERIFIDTEQMGKEARQGHLDTVRSNHTPADIAAVRQAVGDTAEILIRINPPYAGTGAEVDACVANGADVIMLPMWETAAQAQAFLRCVKGRARTCLLLETAQAVAALDETLRLPGLDEVYIGLNDLHLSLGQTFLFEPLADGVVDTLAGKLRAAGLSFGFGGVGRPNAGDALDAQTIVAEHCRLGSSRVILSRSFCDLRRVTEPAQIERVFADGTAALREAERRAQTMTQEELAADHALLRARVADIVRRKKGDTTA